MHAVGVVFRLLVGHMYASSRVWLWLWFCLIRRCGVYIMRLAHVCDFRGCDCEVLFLFLHYRWLVDDMVVVCLEGFVGITPLLVVR